MVERHPYKVDVAGSNPVLPTNFQAVRTSAIKKFAFRFTSVDFKFEKFRCYSAPMKTGSGELR